MSLENDFIKHQVFLDRYSKTLAKNYKKAFKKVDTIIDQALGTLGQTMLRDDISTTLEKATIEMLQELQELALYEADFTRRVLNRRTDLDVQVPEEQAIRNATSETQIKTSPNTSSVLLIGALPAFAEKKTNDYMQIISDGQVLQEEDEVVKEQVADKSSGLFAVQVTSLAALAVLAVANSSQGAVLKASGIDKVVWRNDLESNVCPYCESLDGEVFEIDSAPTLPAHAKCNCDLVPYVQ